MAASKVGRSIWSGSIILGPLNVPVKLYTGYVSDRDQHFRTIHSCGHPVKQAWRCESCEEIVPREELEKAYEPSKNELIKIDLESLPRPVKSEKLEILTCTPVERVEAHHLRGKIYWVLPADEGARYVWSLFYRALEERNVAAIVEATINRLRSPVAIIAYDGLMGAFPLYYPSDYKGIENFFDSSTIVDVPQKEVDLAKRLIGRTLDKKWTLGQYNDDRAQKTAALIEKTILAGDSYNVSDAKVVRHPQLADSMRQFLRKREGA